MTRPIGFLSSRSERYLCSQPQSGIFLADVTRLLRQSPKQYSTNPLSGTVGKYTNIATDQYERSAPYNFTNARRCHRLTPLLQTPSFLECIASPKTGDGAKVGIPRSDFPRQ